MRRAISASRAVIAPAVCVHQRSVTRFQCTRDVGVMVGGLGCLADAVHERERLGEVAKAELALQRALDL